jgi:hypothetical protein
VTGIAPYPDQQCRGARIPSRPPRGLHVDLDREEDKGYYMASMLTSRPLPA